jgi:2-polyprenyl-6-methoxyphenol hydroxylase-like FAD-dependent oxidoreductase
VATSRLLTEEEFTGYLRRMTPLPFKLVASRFLSRYRLHHRAASAFRSGRAFLAGDAAHVHSPVGGQGMNTGIQARSRPPQTVCVSTQ